jgi:hypothetical protein
MNTVVFEHVRLGELPAAWRDKLPKVGLARKSHVAGYLRALRAPAGAVV